MSKELTVGRVNFGSNNPPAGLVSHPAPLFRLSLTLGAAENAEDAIVARMTEYLGARGYNVTAPNATWESKHALMARLGLHNHDSVNRDINLWLSRGMALPVRRSATGKLLEVLSNADFDRFAVRNKTKNNETKT